MFGHQNDQQNQLDDAQQGGSMDGITQPGQDVWQPSAATPPLDAALPPAPATDNPAFNPSIGAPADQMTAAEPATTPVAVDPISPAPLIGDTGSSDLLDIKQHALTQLSPLVGQLDQTPEERFRTTMMMIQASDNQSLVKDAYEAAQQIGDEKARAQALLDVINEINYFTQHHES